MQRMTDLYILNRLENKEISLMAKYECLICGYVYDEEAEGVKFADLADDLVCPDCGAPKEDFEKIE